jgi:hypothetical protein
MTGTIPFVPSATYSEPASSYGFSQFPPAFVGRAARQMRGGLAQVLNT